jgi:hypothetical protein
MDTTTLVLLAGAATWTGVIAWAVHRWKTGQEERERERSMRYEQLIGPALVGGAAGAGGPVVPVGAVGAVAGARDAGQGAGAAAAAFLAPRPQSIRSAWQRR